MEPSHKTIGDSAKPDWRQRLRRELYWLLGAKFAVLMLLRVLFFRE